MSYDDFEARKEAEIRALKRLKNTFFFYALIQLAVLVVYTASVLSMVVSLIFSSFGMVHEEKQPVIALMYSGVAYFVYALFSAYFLDALRRSTEMVEPHVPGVKIARHGIVAYYTHLIVAAPPQVLAMVSLGNVFDLAVSALAVTSGVIMLLATILIGIAIWRVADHYGSSDMRLGVVLMILLSFIGTLVLYSSFDDAIRRVSRRIPPPPKPPWL